MRTSRARNAERIDANTVEKNAMRNSCCIGRGKSHDAWRGSKREYVPDNLLSPLQVSRKAPKVRRPANLFLKLATAEFSERTKNEQSSRPLRGPTYLRGSGSSLPPLQRQGNQSDGSPIPGTWGCARRSTLQKKEWRYSRSPLRSEANSEACFWIHFKYAAQRIRGEWFRLSRGDVHEIQSTALEVSA